MSVPLATAIADSGIGAGHAHVDDLPTAELGVALLVGLGFALVAFPRQY